MPTNPDTDATAARTERTAVVAGTKTTRNWPPDWCLMPDKTASDVGACSKSRKDFEVRRCSVRCRRSGVATGRPSFAASRCSTSSANLALDFESRRSAAVETGAAATCYHAGCNLAGKLAVVAAGVFGPDVDAVAVVVAVGEACRNAVAAVASVALWLLQGAETATREAAWQSRWPVRSKQVRR